MTEKQWVSADRPGGRLFRRYLLAAGLCGFLLVASLGIGSYFILMGNIVREAERDARELAEGMSACELAAVMEDSRRQGTLVVSPERAEEVHEDMTEFLAPFSIVRVKLFDRQGSLLYSSRAGEAGADGLAADPKLQRALAGQVVSEVAHGRDLHEQVLDSADVGYVVETYVPLGDPGQAPLGVFEIYRDVDVAIADGRRTAATLLGCLLGTVAVAFLIQTVIVKEASRRTDETARREARSRADLDRSRQFLQDVIDALPDDLLVLAPDHRILMANRRIRQDCQRDPVHAGLRCYELSHGRSEPCDDPQEMCPLREVLDTGKPAGCTHRHLGGDGRGYYVEVTCSPVMDEAGAVVQVIELSRDITERRQAEMAIQRTNQELSEANASLQEARLRSDRLAVAAEQANKAKSLFLANMSHEMRTPLTSILGYADLMDVGAAESARNPEYLGVIRRNGQHLLELIDDILDLARIEANKMTLRPAPCDLAALVEDVCALTLERAQAKGIGLTVAIDPAAPQAIVTDATRLKQALVNLIGNAVKFTETGGVHLGVGVGAPATAGMEGARGPADAVLIFTVADTGIGMTAETLARVFQPFQQGDDGISRRYGGTGLGLAITRSLAESLGGGLTATSAPGGGSTFTLTIAAPTVQSPAAHPAAAAQGVYPQGAPAPPSPVGPAPDLSGLRILYAEDTKDNQVLVGAILRKAAAARVEIVPDGQAAVQAARSGDFDLILMDWQMPVMDGLAATRMLRAEGYDRPIIALTANAMPQDRRDALDAGCDGFLTKPINRRLLLEAAAQAAAGRPRALPC